MIKEVFIFDFVSVRVKLHFLMHCVLMEKTQDKSLMMGSLMLALLPEPA